MLPSSSSSSSKQQTRTTGKAVTSISNRRRRQQQQQRRKHYSSHRYSTTCKYLLLWLGATGGIQTVCDLLIPSNNNNNEVVMVVQASSSSSSSLSSTIRSGGGRPSHAPLDASSIPPPPPSKKGKTSTPAVEETMSNSTLEQVDDSLSIQQRRQQQQQPTYRRNEKLFQPPPPRDTFTTEKMTTTTTRSPHPSSVSHSMSTSQSRVPPVDEKMDNIPTKPMSVGGSTHSFVVPPPPPNSPLSLRDLASRAHLEECSDQDSKDGDASARNRLSDSRPKGDPTQTTETTRIATLQEKLDELSSESSLPPPPKRVSGPQSYGWQQRPPPRSTETAKATQPRTNEPRRDPPGYHSTQQHVPPPLLSSSRQQQQQQQRHRPVPPHVQQAQQHQRQALDSQGPPPQVRRLAPERPGRVSQQQHSLQFRRDPIYSRGQAHNLPKRQPPGTLQLLWKRVERGLDELADLEDAVTDRAKSMLFSVPVGRKDVSTQTLSQSQSTTATDPSRPSPTSDGAVSVNAPPSDDDVDQGPLKGKHEVHFKLYSNVGAANQNDPASATTTKTTTAGATGETSGSSHRSSPLEELMSGKAKLIRANGGASPPNNRVAPSALRPSRQGDPPQDPRRPAVRQRQTGQQTSEWREGITNPFAPDYSGGKAQRRTNPILRGEPPNAESTNSRGSNSYQGSRDPERQPRPALVDDDEGSSFLGRVARIVPPLPKLPSIPRLLGRGDSYKSYAAASLDAWRSEDEQSRSRGWGGFFRRKKSSIETSSLGMRSPSSRGRKGKTGSSSRTPPIADLLHRCDHGKSMSLLSDRDVRVSRSLGRSRATLDVLALAFFLVAARELAPRLSGVTMPGSLVDLTTDILPKVAEALGTSLTGWLYFALTAVFLCAATNRVFNDVRIHSGASDVTREIKGATEYGQLYLRLVASDPIDRALPERVSYAASSQFVGAVESARLSSFVAIILSVIIVMTVSVVKPALFATFKAMADAVLLRQWRHWPPALTGLGSELKTIFLTLGQTLRELATSEFGGLTNNPMRIAFKASFFVVMLAVAFLPAIETKRPIAPPVISDDQDEEEESGLHTGNVDSLARLGVSSSSRLGLLSKPGALEANLERWRTTPASVPGEFPYSSIRSKLLLVAYGLLAATLLAVPPVALAVSNSPVDTSALNSFVRLDSLLDLSILSVFALHLAWRALSAGMTSSVAGSATSSFLQALAAAVADFDRSQYSPQMNLQTAASISPTKGLELSDLWAAHTSKRAWAVRGASLTCRNGELVVILGDDGSGKTRLLTAIAEAMLHPPKSALSTSIVRGTVSMGGLDTSKWDRMQLKRRLGLALNDVRTVTDNAELLSGMTLEEILEPVDDMHNPNEPHTLSANERACIALAMQLSGLSTTLLPRLPSKLATVVSANEDELKPSPLRPRCNVLSPSEWSKLLLARVLAQTILDNDNVAKSSNSIDKCLIGSVLLLDDALVHMSEVEEAQFLVSLRRTGAATLVSSHKWATGRHADRVVVVKDGAIVEQGTHNELLSRGPNQSLYANKWHAMTNV